MVVVSSLTYSHRRGPVLSFPDFSVEEGESCLLLGESGSGKTTLLHLIGGLLKVQKGIVQIGGSDLSQLSESQADAFRGRNVGFIFQRDHLISSLSVFNNLLMAPYLAGIRADETKVDELLGQLGLMDKKHAHISHLSQGQAQRVAIARALINRPAVILADEPTSALDDENCNRVISLLIELSRRYRSTLVVATHDQRLRSVISRQVHIPHQAA